MTLTKILLLTLLSAIAVILGLCTIAPPEIKVENSVSFAATPELVFPHIQFFEKRNTWSPWLVYDPNVSTELKAASTSFRAIGVLRSSFKASDAACMALPRGFD